MNGGMDLMGRMERGKFRNRDAALMERCAGRRLPAKLPLIHVTSVYYAKKIVDKYTLKPDKCDVFGRELLYFFVMRPAYCLRYGDEKSQFLSHFPIVFVLKPNAVEHPHHVYPFDTGGAAAGAFAKRADRLIRLEEYELHNSHEAAAGYIEWAFGDLRNYYDGHLRPDIADGVRAKESVVVSLISIARMGVEGDNIHDKRASTVEIATSDYVQIRGLVDLIVFPDAMLEKPDLFNERVDELEKLGATVEHYKWKPNCTPNEFQSEIMKICRDWYESRGRL